jgi:pimeloyl-ACP methyl ester carboxylesterase
LKKLLSVILLLLAGCANLPGAKSVSTPHGEFTYYVSDDRKPTVVFEAGLGDDMTSWQNVISKVTTFTGVFAYNRAGFSGSSSVNAERNGEVIVAELRQLLTQANVRPPYVLVGHSMGGLYMELYAKTYPQAVAGVVLIDPNSSKYPVRCQSEKLQYCEPPSQRPLWASLFFPPAVPGEIAGIATTHAQVNAIEPFPNVPLVVLSAAELDKNTTVQEHHRQQLYTQVHRELAALSPTSQFIMCDSCSHDIHKDQPDLVVNAIKWVLAQADTF